MQNRVMPHREKSPRCIVIAGPNGAGKTTFAREFLPKEAGVVHFVNMDLLAAGLSPLKPELAGVKVENYFCKNWIGWPARDWILPLKAR